MKFGPVWQGSENSTASNARRGSRSYPQRKERLQYGLGQVIGSFLFVSLINFALLRSTALLTRNGRRASRRYLDAQFVEAVFDAPQDFPPDAILLAG